MNIFSPSSEKINYFILFIIIILTHNYLLNTPVFSRRILVENVPDYYSG